MHVKHLSITITFLFSLLLPSVSQARPISIPDPNLAAAIQQEIGNSITTHTLLNLTRLEAPNRGIRDLTGLEHARHLVSLNLGAEDVDDQTINSNTVSDLSPLSGLTELRVLILSDNNITDVSHLAKLTRLEGLSLWGNNITDVSPLAKLIQLEWLWLGSNTITDVSPLAKLLRLNNLGLGNNNISDVSTLVRLPQLALLILWQNPLSPASIDTHIPAMQANGTEVQFDPAYDPEPDRPITEYDPEPDRPIVRLIYFLPRDRQPEPGMDAKMDKLIKDVQQFYAAQMEAHGFGRKTFMFQVDERGKAVVHHVNGKLATTHYLHGGEPLDEFSAQVNKKNFYFIITEDGGERPVGEYSGECGYGGTDFLKPSFGGFVHIFSTCIGTNIAIHELGHAFGLAHDWRSDNYIMSYGSSPDKLSRCAAEWLDVHRAFNPIQPVMNEATTVKMDKPSLASSPDAIRLRFEVTDIDGIHQLQLIGSTPLQSGYPGLIACKALNGNSSGNFEFVASLLPKTDVKLQIIDINGNISRSDPYPIDVLSHENIITDKITGPWLWMIAPTQTWQGGAQSIAIDSLERASTDALTEADVATHGAKAGDTVGKYIWTLGSISTTGPNNINELINRINLSPNRNIDDHSSYALITLESATAQPNVTMKAGSDDAIKIWLNGEVVHNKPVNRGANDFLDTFKVDLEKGDNLLLVKVSERGGNWSMFVGIDADVNAVYKSPQDPVPSVDVNGDGIVNIQDLVLVSSNFGKTGQNPADVNGDGVVNISDLVLVAGAFGEGAAAAPTLHTSDLEGFTAADLQQRLTQARQMTLTDPAYLRDIAVLEQLLMLLLPKETSLLPNYPNPFNPETWIPYQLTESTEVTLTIYAVDGRVVRQLVLGHQPAGMYHSKNRAAYWNGRNEQGERVASGLYFYTLSAGDYTATRKLLIRK